jgi:hypothetical protein
VTLTQLLQLTYDSTGFSSPPTGTSDRFTRWINEAHRMILRDPATQDLRLVTMSFASVANQKYYGLPQGFEIAEDMVNQANQQRVRMKTRDVIKTYDPGDTSSGLPMFWIPWGLQCVTLDPASTGLWIASDQAGDTTQIVTLQGIRADGDIQKQLTATLNGTTLVSIGTYTDYTQVLMWSMSAVATGNVTLYDAAAAGNVLGRIPIGQTSVQYQKIRLWPTPASAYTFLVDGRAEISDLVNPNDVPLLPPSFHDLLSTYAIRQEFRRTNDSRYQATDASFVQGFGTLKAFQQYPADYRPVAGSRQGIGWLWPNLPGGWFPNDYGGY